MIDTAENMEKLRRLLLTTPVPFHDALAVAKEMMLHGVNDREVWYFQSAATLLLDRVVRPLLQGSVEQDSNLKRLISKIRRNPGFDPREALDEIAKMAASPSGTAPTATRELAERLMERLNRIPEFQTAVTTGERTETAGWSRILAMVDSCIQEQGREQRRQEREWQRRRGELLRLGDIVMQAAERMHHPTEGLQKVLSLLSSKEPLNVVLPTFVENFLLEARALKKAARLAKENILKADEAIHQLNGLFRQADIQLQESRDQELFDQFTGLGNRFALTEHRKRYLKENRQALLFVFFDEDPNAMPKLARSEVYRVLGFVGRHIQKSHLGLSFHIGDATIAVLIAEAYIDKEVAQLVKDRILDRLQATKGFPTHVRFGIATIQVTATTGSDENALLDKGKHWARNSALKGGQPLKMVMEQG
ncbi:MAG: hypothetical protein HQL77_03155 [Magnetococcales bacterium]|nr:hypothetical protein [Magnetococcales bacterium]